MFSCFVLPRFSQHVALSLVYRASSPDELALVETARKVGYAFLSRTSNRIFVDVYGEQKEIELLNVLE